MNSEQTNALARLKEAAAVVDVAFDIRILTSVERAALVAQVAILMRLDSLPARQPWRF